MGWAHMGPKGFNRVTKEYGTKINTRKSYVYYKQRKDQSKHIYIQGGSK